MRSQLIAKFGSQALDATYEARLRAATPAAVDDHRSMVATRGVPDELDLG